MAPDHAHRPAGPVGESTVTEPVSTTIRPAEEAAERSPDYRPRRAAKGLRQGPFVALGIQVVAVLAVLAAAGAFVLRTHDVTIVDDGAARTVATRAGSVSALLHQAGLTIGKHDTVRPAPGASVGDRVVIGRGRPVRLTLDGKRSTRYVTSRTVHALLATLGLADRPTRVDGPAGGAIPRAGAAVTIRTRKHVTVVVDGKTTRYTTYAATVRELVADEHLRLAADDQTEPAAGHTLAGVTRVSIFRVTTRTTTETVTVKAPVKTEKRGDWMLDQQEVVDSGRDGKRKQKVEYIYRDGKKWRKKVLSSKELVSAKPRVVAKGTTPYPPDDTGLNWDALAQCESGGNPHSVSANGQFMGLYQFSQDTWNRMGGIGRPSDATPREQTYRAIQLYKAAGKDQWPVCGANL